MVPVMYYHLVLKVLLFPRSYLSNPPRRWWSPGRDEHVVASGSDDRADGAWAPEYLCRGYLFILGTKVKS